MKSCKTEEKSEDGGRDRRDDHRRERKWREDQTEIRDDRRKPATERLGRRARGRSHPLRP